MKTRATRSAAESSGWADGTRSDGATALSRSGRNTASWKSRIASCKPILNVSEEAGGPRPKGTDDVAKDGAALDGGHDRVLLSAARADRNRCRGNVNGAKFLEAQEVRLLGDEDLVDDRLPLREVRAELHHRRRRRQSACDRRRASASGVVAVLRGNESRFGARGPWWQSAAGLCAADRERTGGRARSEAAERRRRAEGR